MLLFLRECLLFKSTSLGERGVLFVIFNRPLFFLLEQRGFALVNFHSGNLLKQVIEESAQEFHSLFGFLCVEILNLPCLLKINILASETTLHLCPVSEAVTGTRGYYSSFVSAKKSSRL